MRKKKVVRRPWRGATSLRTHTDEAIASAPRGWRRLLRAFAEWLEKDRALALSSIRLRVGSAIAFVAAQEGSGIRGLKRLGAIDIEDFFIGYAKDHGPAATRQMQAAMRLIFRFAAARKWVKRDLANAVPGMRSYRLSGMPRGLSSDGVGALIAASAGKSARDRAIVLLFAIYGVRRGQVCALRLGDIDWRSRTITFGPHKGGKPVQHELAPAVAEALSEYLQYERPAVEDEAVLLRSKAPHLPLGPGAVTMVVRGLLEQLALKCSPCGPHALRHAFATRLLHAGQPLKTIADLLGHRSLQAVSIYAKVDHPRLLEVAMEWPEVMS